MRKQCHASLYFGKLTLMLSIPFSAILGVVCYPFVKNFLKNSCVFYARVFPCVVCCVGTNRRQLMSPLPTQTQHNTANNAPNTTWTTHLKLCQFSRLCQFKKSQGMFHVRGAGRSTNITRFGVSDTFDRFQLGLSLIHI